MALDHSAADVLRYLMGTLGLGVNPEVGSVDGSEDWIITVSQMPDSPDRRITIYDTTGITDNRNHIDGTLDEHKGVMIQARCSDRTEGQAKAEEIQEVLDQDVYEETVSIGLNTYVVHSVSRRGTINYLGKEPNTSRVLFTLNCILSLKQTS